MANQFPTFWPGWETVKILGRGSFGTVYEIRRDVLGTTERAALKVISIPKSSNEIEELYSEGFSQESITKRFQSYLQDIIREYSLMQEMKGHTNVVYCDDLRYIQRSDGIGWDIYIKMELLTAMTKALPVDVPEDVVIKAGLDLCSALMLCKKKHIVHRDIKPQNIFLSKDGDFKLGDFGIARTMDHTTSGTKTGTYKYMAPEVYHNQPYGATADIYSLGLVLYWLLNQRRMAFLPLPPRTPTVSEEDSARARRLSGEPLPAPLSGSRELQRIVLKACAFRPEDRYQSPGEMHKDLSALTVNPAVWDVLSRPNPADDESTIYEATELESKKKKKFPRWAAGLAAALAVAVGGFLFHPHQWQVATCEKAETCSLCGETRGEIAGHLWTDAACGSSQTCTHCGLTQGEALAHQWSAATCEAPQTCSLCGQTQGQPGEHQFLDATYVSPAACSQCGQTQGHPLASPFSAGSDHSMFRHSDGTVSLFGSPIWGHADLTDWQNISAVASGGGHIAGLKADGTVVAKGYQHAGVGDVINWTDIVQIAADQAGTVGLKADGTCLSVGTGQYNLHAVTQWQDIVAVDAKFVHRVGLKSDGTVVAVGLNDDGQCEVSGWTDIVAVRVGRTHTVGLKADGTVVAVGNNAYSQCRVSSWKNVVAIEAGEDFTVALHADGTVSAIGRNSDGQCELTGWTDIVSICAGYNHVLGLKSDGTILTAGNNYSGQCNIPADFRVK